VKSIKFQKDKKLKRSCLVCGKKTVNQVYGFIVCRKCEKDFDPENHGEPLVIEVFDKFFHES